MAQINDELVASSPPGPRNRFIWDDEIIGFGLKVTPAGARIFVFQYRRKEVSPTTKRYTIGRADRISAAQAAAFAQKLKQKLLQGIDPHELTPPWDRKRGASSQKEARWARSKDEAILKAGAAIYLEKGYGASIDLVSEHACVSRQTIYNRFGSKSALVRQVIQYACETIVGPMMSIDVQLPVDTALLNFARENYKTNINSRGVGLARLAISASTKNPSVGRDLYKYATHRVQLSLERYLAHKHDEGLLHVPDIAFAAEHFMSVVLGLSRSSLIYGPLPTMSEREPYITSAVNMFLRAYDVQRQAGPDTVPTTRGRAGPDSD